MSSRPHTRAALAATALALALGVVGAAPAPSFADTPGCVTKKEWKTAKPGYKMTGIHSRFDTRGERTHYYLDEETMTETQSRLYERCSGLAHVAIEYERVPGGVWRMTYKWGW